MKIIAVGDIHGRTTWKDIVAKEADADKYIFIGDYFDTRYYTISGNIQITNFKEILELKKRNPEQVIMLMGNHDLHYLKGIDETYSGHQAGYALEIGEIIGKAINDGHLQMCYHLAPFFFSHAGLTKTWCKDMLDIESPMVDDSLVSTINDYLIYKPRVFKFNMGANFSDIGNDITQGPVWVRPESLAKDMVDGITCVVGHTPAEKLGPMQLHPQIIRIDCLGWTNEYLVIEDGQIRAEVC
jgi:hypothetical protein